jgi:hypothetical protein
MGVRRRGTEFLRGAEDRLRGKLSAVELEGQTHAIEQEQELVWGQRRRQRSRAAAPKSLFEMEPPGVGVGGQVEALARVEVKGGR